MVTYSLGGQAMESEKFIIQSLDTIIHIQSISDCSKSFFWLLQVNMLCNIELVSCCSNPGKRK
jgi:hypothetical protein